MFSGFPPPWQPADPACLLPALELIHPVGGCPCTAKCWDSSCGTGDRLGACAWLWPLLLEMWQELTLGQPTSAAKQPHLQFLPSPRLAPFGLQKNTQKATEDPELLTQPLPGHDVQLPSVRMGQGRGNTSLPLKQRKT